MSAGLKWRKEKTGEELATCGPIVISVFQGAGRYDFKQWQWHSTGGYSRVPIGPNTKAEAKFDAELWLREQAYKMLADLAHHPTGAKK